MQAPFTQWLYSIIQSELSEHRSPNKAVTTRTVAGVGRYAGAKSPPKWIDRQYYSFADVQLETFHQNRIHL